MKQLAMNRASGASRLRMAVQRTGMGRYSLRRTRLAGSVKMAKNRRTVEWDYPELKRESGPGYFEASNRRGFHHHATLYMAARGFLVAERNRFSPLPAPVISESPP